MPLFLAFLGAVPLFGKGAFVPPSRPTSGIAVARAACQRRASGTGATRRQSEQSRGLSSMARSHPLTGEHAKACYRVGGGRAPILTSSAYRGGNPPINRNDLRGARQAASIIAPRPCIRRILARSQTMMQTCASTAKLRGGGPFLAIGWKARMVSGITATSDRYRRLVNRPTAEIYA
jgi:hypothetical protein